MAYRIRRVLIAVADPEARANKAVRRGVEIARRSGASIELFNSVALTGSYGDISRAESREFARLLQEQSTRQLENTAKRLRRDGSPRARRNRSKPGGRWALQARSKRSAFITFVHAATKSATNFSLASLWA